MAQSRPTIFVIGERCSGTNLARRLLENCFPNVNVVDSCALGYKHWPHFCQRALDPAFDIRVVSLTRNVLDWIVSMSKTMWNLKHIQNGGIDGLITQSPWWSHNGDDWSRRVVFDSALPFGSFYKDIFDLRARKHQFWRAALLQSSRRHVWVRYEDLCLQPEAVLLRVAEHLGLGQSAVTVEQSGLMTQHAHGGPKGGFNMEVHLQKQVFHHGRNSANGLVYSKSEWDRVHQRVEWAAEEELGYLYTEAQGFQQDFVHPPLTVSVATDVCSKHKIAYVWVAKFWTSKLHYIKEEEIRRWGLFADVFEASALPTSLADYDHVLIDSTSTPISYYVVHGNYMEYTERIVQTLKTAKNLIIDMHDMHQHSFIGGFEGMRVFVRDMGNINLMLTKVPPTHAEFVQMKSILQGNVEMKYVPFGVPEQFILVPSMELMVPKWRHEKYTMQPCHHKKVDVLLYGSTHELYPLRRKCADVLRENVANQQFKILPFTGPDPIQMVPEAPSRAKLYHEVRLAWMSVCTSSSFSYLVMKYWEALACGCAIIGDLPVDLPAEFRTRQYPLVQTNNTRQIKNVIAKAHSDRATLIETCRRNYEAVALRYTLTQRVVDMVSDIIGGEGVSYADMIAAWVAHGPVY